MEFGEEGYASWAGGLNRPLAYIISLRDVDVFLDDVFVLGLIPIIPVG